MLISLSTFSTVVAPSTNEPTFNFSGAKRESTFDGLFRSLMPNIVLSITCISAFFAAIRPFIETERGSLTSLVTEQISGKEADNFSYPVPAFLDISISFSLNSILYAFVSVAILSIAPNLPAI